MAADAAGSAGQVPAFARIALREGGGESSEKHAPKRERSLAWESQNYSTRNRNSNVANASWQELQARPTAWAAGLTAF